MGLLPFLEKRRPGGHTVLDGERKREGEEEGEGEEKVGEGEGEREGERSPGLINNQRILAWPGPVLLPPASSAPRLKSR